MSKNFLPTHQAKPVLIHIAKVKISERAVLMTLGGGARAADRSAT
jgi:hypothetical protein